jgi:hypothetical protein
MEIIDLHNPERVSGKPDDVKTLLSNNVFTQDEFKISKIELRLYEEQLDVNLGIHYLITSFIETDKGTIEMLYDEGFLGDNALSRIAEFLTSNLGLSALILRSVISLRNRIS